MIEHVTRLLDDDRLRIDTTGGRRPLKGFMKDVTTNDRGTDVKRTMSDLDRPDRTLQAQMPLGESVDVVVSQKKWLGFGRRPVGRLYVVCVSPTRELVAGSAPEPMKKGDVSKVLSSVPPGPNGVPSTVVIVATAGVAIEARELADRGPERTVIIAEPTDAGGWHVSGPMETKALVDLFDPEPDDDKRRRITSEIESPLADLGGAGVATDKLAGKLGLPVPFVEAELKAYAKSHAGLVAKRLDGRVVLFREGSTPVGSSSSTSSAISAAGGSGMPLIDRMKSLFARKGETEKKIAFLAERRTALSQQRDRAYEEMHAVEEKESTLRTQFKSTSTEAAKRRLTSHLLQLRKELDRRQQMVGVFNSQIDVVSTHLHNLELLQQGKSAKLPDSDEITGDAARAEEMLAELQASTEAAAGATSSLGGGLNDEEQALYDELTRDAAQPVADAPAIDAEVLSTMPKTPDQPNTTSHAATRNPPRRNEPEAG